VVMERLEWMTGSQVSGVAAGPVSDLTAEYAARTIRSGDHHREACRHLPGGETRSVTMYQPYPVVLAEGHGAMVRDLDGNEYVDVLNNYTSLVHGHGFGPVVEAVTACLPSGTAFPAPHPAQLRLAGMLTGRYPAVQQVRFTNSGTEASLLALRVARSATGRRRIVTFTGAYHGGVPEIIDGGPDTVPVRYNDADQAVAAIDSSVAAVFAEPFLGSAGVIPAAPGFLSQIADRARQVGAVFVLDEVQSLRNAPNGTHAALGLEPDLLLMGKIIGGGFPVGAVGGGAALMELTSAARPGALSCSGTFNGNVITMTAGAAALAALDGPAIGALNERASGLGRRIEAAAARAGIPVCVTRAGSILEVHLTGRAPICAEEAAAVPAAWASALHLALLLEGVYAAPRGSLNLSTAIGDDLLACVADGYARAFGRIRDVIVTRDPVTSGTG
jgi:glutamate-1-semialdehyde 2,1-aminomutase